MKALFLLLLCASPMLAQDGTAAYGFKGDVIGESLHDFRTRNRVNCSGDMHQGQRPEMPDFSRINPKQIAQAYATYSDALRVYEGSYPPHQQILDAQAKQFGEEKLCQIEGGVDIAGAGGGAGFWIKDDRLDMITGQFRREYFAQVKKAIVAKYGDPTETAVRDYRNDMGAQFKGEVATWTRPDSCIELSEVKTGDTEASSMVIANPVTRKAFAAASQAKANGEF